MVPTHRDEKNKVRCHETDGQASQ